MGILILIAKLAAVGIALWFLLTYTIFAIAIFLIAGILYSLFYYNNKDKLTRRSAGNW